MEEATEEKSENLPEANDSRVVEKVQEEDIEIITKTTNIFVHSERSHVESSYMSTQPTSLVDDLQTSVVSGETMSQEYGSKKIVRFDEKTEIVPSGDREESYESETKDAEVQHVERAEDIRTEEVTDAREADEPMDEEVIVSVSSDIKEAAEHESVLSTPKHDVGESVELPDTIPNTEKIEESVANVTMESSRGNETSKLDFETALENVQPQEEIIQKKSKGPDEPLEEQLEGPLEEHQPVSSAVKEVKSSSREDQAQIQDESVKEQLHEIINEIDVEIGKEDEGTSHTWKPKGVYKVEKTEIKYEDIVPIKVDDVKIEDRSKEEAPKKKMEKKELKIGIKVEIDHNMENYTQGEPSPHSKLLRHCLINGEVLSPQEIPIGIPLLAKILPKENEEDHEKIPLERLFTPASDWEEIIPHKKKAYASSCFYRPDHPTIDDQVELAHKISTSLVDETNKTSKGQTMYIKRKNRSAKWIHQGEDGMFEDSAASQYDMDDNEEGHQTKEKPPLKLVVNKNIAQDYSQIQHHYEELLSTSQTLQQISNMEVGKEIATDLQSPTGKGAALFAKRKKRMDKFIIDETTIQQQQQQQQQQQKQQQQSIVHEEIKTSTTTTVNNYQTSAFESKFSSQNQKQMNALRLQNAPAVTAPSVAKTDPIQPGSGAIYTAEVKVIQKTSPIPTSSLISYSAPAPQHSILSDLASVQEKDKRKSFNLAPKGWGTYNTYYTPVHLGAP